MLGLVVLVAVLGATTQRPEAVPSGCAAAPPECVALGGFTGDTFSPTTWTGAVGNNSNATLRHCVFSNAPAAATPKTYNVTITGTGTSGGAFLLSGPGGDLPYQVAINDNNPNSFVDVSAGVPASFDALTEAVYNTCTNSGTSANGQRLRVRVLGSVLQGFEAGTYTGTMTMVVASPDATSTDTEISGTITVTIPSYVRLLNLEDNFSFGTWNPDTGAAGLTRFDNSVCVWSNHSLDDYTVTATTGTGAFEVTGTPGTIPFEVWWSDVPGVTTVAGSDAELDYNTAATFTSTATTLNCGGGSTASMVLFMSEDDLSDIEPGSFNATLNISIGIAP